MPGNYSSPSTLRSLLKDLEKTKKLLQKKILKRSISDVVKIVELHEKIAATKKEMHQQSEESQIDKNKILELHEKLAATKR